MRTINRRFVRHYVQMVVVMLLGMVVLGLPVGLALGAAGTSWSDLGAQPMLGLMAFTMTAPMVWWMQRMGHGWRPNLEMALSMIVPTIAVIAIHAIGVLRDTNALLAIEHVAMLLGMFGVMVLRPEEYSHAHHDHHEIASA